MGFTDTKFVRSSVQKIFLPFLFTLILTAIAFNHYFDLADKIGSDNIVPNVIEDPAEDPIARAEQEFMMLRDPVTNKIPAGIYQREQEFAAKLPKRKENILSKSGVAQNVQALTWTERGPNNVGGRTRAFAVDKRNTSIMIAGGVSGGIWRSTDEGVNWVKTTTSTQLHSVSCLVQDPRTGQEDTWYAGTGEIFGNSASGGGASYRGDGIFKSIDNGLSWNLLSNTSTGRPDLYDNEFDYVHNLAVSLTNGYVYAAASNVILRSTNNGTDWTTLRGSFAAGTHSEVRVTSTGIVYAAIRNGLTHAGIWKSVDNGDNWTNITPVNGTNATENFPTTYTRIVIGIAPSDEDIVYILAYTPNAGKPGSGGLASDGHSFWKYDDGLAGTSRWVNRSANLPTWVNPVGGFTSQGGYDMVLHVKPDDANFVIIGGTNLFRTTDGASTAMGLTTTHWIGGYAYANNISQYAAHHPDLHSGFYKSSSSIVYYSGHDGGLSKTTNITAVPVFWTNLDQTYNTSQFYSVSIAPESGSNYLLGGLQDNGNQKMDAAGLANWIEVPGGGDGTFDEVAPLADNRVYASQQNGRMLSFQRDFFYIQDFAPTGPSGAVNQLFVNPFALDPNNSNILYYAGGDVLALSNPPLGTDPTSTGLWRNNDVNHATDPAGQWTQLTSTKINSTLTNNVKVSAIGVSTTNSTDVVYYGTTSGVVKRVDNANTGSTPTTSADLGGSLPDAYVSSIAVDPTNSNNAMLTFSNYSVQSIWYTANGGTSWTDVEGNLSGASGPSIRWAAVFPISGVTHYFLGTSVGIYFTVALSGGTTVWTQEATTSIGNVVCTMVDWRIETGSLPKTTRPSLISSTNTVSAVVLAVATHGRGVFTANVNNPLPVELVTFSGVYNSGSVVLNWETATEVTNFGFEIEKSISKNSWEKIGFVKGHGNSNSPKSYSFSDNSLYGGDKFYYRLKQIDTDGKYEYSNIVEVSIKIQGFELSQNYPNPFNPSTTIRYSIPKSGLVTIKVYDISGKEVVLLVNENKSTGSYTVNFNAANLASGVYLYRLQAGNFVETKKLMLLK